MQHLQQSLDPNRKQAAHLFSNEFGVISMAVSLGGPHFQDIFSKDHFSMYGKYPRAKHLCHDDILIPALFLFDDSAHQIEAQFYSSYDGVNFQNELNCEPAFFDTPAELSNFLDTHNSLAMHLHEVMALNKFELEDVYSEARQKSMEEDPQWNHGGWDLNKLTRCISMRNNATFNVLSFLVHFIVIKIPRHYTILGAGLDAFTVLARPTLISTIYNRMLTAYIRKSYPEYNFDLVLHHDIDIQHQLHFDSIDDRKELKKKTIMCFGSHEILLNHEAFPLYHFAPSTTHIHMRWLQEPDDNTQRWRDKNYLLYLINTNLIDLRNVARDFYKRRE